MMRHAVLVLGLLLVAGLTCGFATLAERLMSVAPSGAPPGFTNFLVWTDYGAHVNTASRLVWTDLGAHVE